MRDEQKNTGRSREEEDVEKRRSRQKGYVPEQNVLQED